MFVKIVTKADWKDYSPDFFKAIFDMPEYTKIENIDFAAIVFDDTDHAIGYSTFRELDRTHVYMQYGGAMQKSAYHNLKAYLLLIEGLKGSYLTVSTYIENQNLPMLKLAMKAGFRVIGTRTYKNKIYLEHYLEV